MHSRVKNNKRKNKKKIIEGVDGWGVDVYKSSHKEMRHPRGPEYDEIPLQ